MSLDTRNNSALFKRAEQLKRWEESDTNREPVVPKNVHARKIKFSSGCVFLAACMSGDKDEVLRLLDNGADIDTANVDGLTALHQACIDDNLDMVEFLVQHGSGVNRADNEGWTPLHATASCGFVSIARYLLENGADLRAVNSDGELAIDLSASNSMENLLQMQINEQGINCEEARQCEERMMLNDAKKWLRSDASEADRPHGRTGATSLHVAAAKGYTKVLTLLLAGRADVDKQDNDGWTPLHAAAHWGQKEAAQMLVASLADMDIKNYAGQTALDVADPDIIRYLTELRTNSKRNKRRTGSQLRFPDNMDSIETPPKVIRVEVKPELKEEARLKCLDRISESDDASDSDDHYTESTESTASSISETLDEKPKPPSEPAAPRENNMEEDTNAWRRSGPIRNNQGKLESPTKTQVPDKEPQPTDSEVILRRTQSFENDEKFYQKYRELRERIKANSCPVLPATPITGVGGGGGGVNTTNSYSVQRSASLKDHRQLRKTTVSLPLSPTTPAATTPTSGQVRSNQTKDNQAAATNSKLFSSIGGSAMNLNATVIDPNTPLPSPRHASSVQNLSSDASSMMFTNGRNSGARENINPTNNKLVEKNQSNVQQVQQQQQQQTTSQPPQPPPITTTSTFNKLSPGNIFKNFFKSFVPPVRDEESETQRKAHAKRVRETRRSTQGVTLDEIKSAEELVKKKNLNNNNNSTNNENPSTTTTTTSAINDRVPSTNVNDDNDDNNSKESATAKQEQSSGGGSSGSGISGDVIDEQITASYTITAPTICKRDNNDDKGDEGEDNENNDGGDDDGEDEEQISASYTISPPPISNNVSFNASIPDKKSNRQLSSPTSRVGGGGEGGGGSGGGGDSETTSITATINVPSSNIKKTDLEELTKTASPTVVQTSFKFDKLDNHKTSESEATDLDKEPTTQQSRYNRDKRSLFDIDNASSLSLAEKLRNEANKYSEANQSNNDLSTGLNHNKINSTELSETNDNSSNTSSNNSKKCDSTSSSPSHQQQVTAAERRPSWRIKFDAGSKFKLEDASAVNNSNQSDSATSSVTGTSTTVTAIIAQRRPNSINNSGITTITTTTNPRPVSAPIITNSNLELNNDRIKDAVNNDSDLALRRLKNSEDKENDKENDSRSAQATQAVIQRRKRPKRRSTGVVHVDMDDLDPDRQESPVDGDDKESGSERSSRTRLGSAGSTDQQQNDAKTENDTSAENGEIIDYKALYEASRAENNKLKQQLQKQEDTLQSTKAALERFTNATTKNSLSELEKRERRAMERKLSEMEEELKQLEALKTENQRLKDENGALIRVISKLSK